jgi:hypothetical protein
MQITQALSSLATGFKLANVVQPLFKLPNGGAANWVGLKGQTVAKAARLS